MTVAFKQKESVNDLLHQFLRTIVHNLGVVGADELAVKAAACGGVENVPIDLAIAIHNHVFAGETFSIWIWKMWG